MPQRTKPLAPSEWLSLVAHHAAALRDAGVQSLTLEGLSITFRESTPHPGVFVDEPDESSEHPDPLYDASTYAGGKVPGYSLDRAEHDDEE